MRQILDPNYVPFKQAKLLKEKGFNVNCNYWWVETNSYTLNCPRDGEIDFPAKPPRVMHYSNDTWSINHCFAPEQWQVVEWLRITHDIHITYGCDYNWKLKEYRGKAKFYYIINFDLLDSLDKNLEPKFLFDTPQEAYIAAFDYILKNNLI